MSKKGQKKIARMVTNKLVQLIDEKEELPWSKPWRTNGPQRNPISGTVYRGINIPMLMSHQMACEYDQPLWLTYKQAKKEGGHVKKGESSTFIIFWKIKSWIEEEENDEGETEEIEKSVPIMRYYKVFNIEQTTLDIEDYIDEDFDDIPSLKKAEQFIENMPDGMPPVKHAGGRACYKPVDDEIMMPKRKRFDSSESYYKTLFHEYAHGTGHKKRLNRDTINENFTDTEMYSKEELIAELTASFVSAQIGLEWDEENSAAYIDGWRKRLTTNTSLIISCSQTAQKAFDYLRNYDPTQKENNQ